MIWMQTNIDSKLEMFKKIFSVAIELSWTAHKLNETRVLERRAIGNVLSNY